jgi:CHAT domain-containing protein
LSSLVKTLSARRAWKSLLLTVINLRGDYQAAFADYVTFYKTIPQSEAGRLPLLTLGSQLSYEQGNYVAALQYAEKALAIETLLGTSPTSGRLLSQKSNQVNALIGLQRFADAAKIFDAFDVLAEQHPSTRNRTRYYQTRGIAYLGLGEMQKAVLNLRTGLKSYVSRVGEEGNTTVITKGLLGVAIWSVRNTNGDSNEAYRLLSESVKGILLLTNKGELRQTAEYGRLKNLIFSTYIEAASQTNPTDALAALGIADWLRGGLVQEALGDAAVRAAASNTALSDLVRQDQDARNEMKGLRNFLSGEAGGAASPLPEVAAKMRERIALLEKSRADVQVQIKAKFPDYERLVRPLPPSTTEIQARLKSDEALVVLQPTDSATYVWAVNKDGTSQFHRAAVSESELKRLVTRLRGTLDVAGQSASRMPAFDHVASQELYQKLLAPVQSGLAGKTSLIVAAGGVLGQIPFGVLQTGHFDKRSANGKAASGMDAPWLIKQAAITHVPSVAAWLSMRALPHKTAEQPMMAWGDPLFNLGNVAQASASKGTVSEVRKVNLTRANIAVDLEKEDPRSALKYADIPPLPETRDELVAIAKTLGADAAKDLILGSAATRESVLAANKNGSLAKRRVVAFATHGLMAGDLPNLTQPALAMAGTKDDATNVLAPLLTLEDVLTLKLNADWVVLSACNTAAADGKAEEALSGLARGFFYAGSRSLLVTHWAVDSDSAVTLTTETFKHYQNNPTAQKAESLRQAMLTVLSNPTTAHPAYWAPYALVGDGSR